jgi:Na+-translocating ferredoxin:NAD+ oxidoreductase RNF subunit RnfB
MGVELALAERQVAALHCHGTNVRDGYRYSGVRDCRAAALVHGGPKECAYGCIGFGTCVEACKFNAIVMGPEALPLVIARNCVACGACVKACPKGLFELAPESKGVVIRCSSHDKGGTVRKICETGCIACQKCVKTCPVEAISIDGFLAVIDYEKCRDCGDCVAVCPMHTIAQVRERSDNERDESCRGNPDGTDAEPVGSGAVGG